MRRSIRFSYSVGGPVASQAVEQGIEAEKLGYDAIWVADHLADIPPITAVFDAWPMLSYIGARTKRIQLGSGVTDIQRVHPAKLASSVATLDNVTRGRAVLGIGAGEVMNVRPYGMEWESAAIRVARFREYLRIVRRLWSTSYDSPATMKGKFYSMHEAHLGLRPISMPRPPIYVGAFASEKMLRIAGELADGWFPGAYYNPDSFKQKVQVLRNSSRKTGRKFADFDVMANIPVILNPDSRTMSAVRQKFKRSLVINRYMLKLLGEDDAYEQVSKQFQYQLITPTAHYDRLLWKVVEKLAVSQESLERGMAEMMAVGNVDNCIETFEKFAKAGATHVHVSSFMAARDTYKRVANSVVPSFKARR